MTGSMKMDTRTLTRTALLLALTLAIQAFRFPPVVTGPLVNFMLALSVMLVGTGGGMLIGFITPWIALVAGILPAPLAPAVPFIMIGNAVFCLLIGAFARNVRLRLAGVMLGAVGKFAVIGGAVSRVLTLPAPLAQALLFPQLTNALIGGYLAVSVAYTLRWALSAQNAAPGSSSANDV